MREKYEGSIILRIIMKCWCCVECGCRSYGEVQNEDGGGGVGSALV